VLVEAAVRLIAADGPAAVTHRRVAAEAGLPLASTTYWFKSKDELLIAAYELAAERDMARVREVAASLKTDDLAARLTELVTGELTEHHDALMASYALWLESARRPALRSVERSWTEEYAAVMADVLRAAGAEDPEGAARLLIATLDGLMLGELANDRPADPAELRPLIERLLRGLLAR
jgi:DNA-binding transcriptional regulator YbjK